MRIPFSGWFRAAVTFGLAVVAGFTSSTTLAADDPSAIIGRWDVVVTEPGLSYPSWFEVTKSGHRTLVGRYVGRFGSARPISEVTFKDGVMRFAVPPQWEGRKTDVVYEGRFKGKEIHGTTTNDQGETITWKAVPAPALSRPWTGELGKSMPLFNGQDLSGWKAQFADRGNGWIVRDGMLVNAQPGNNIITEQTFTDFKLEAEFRYPKGSNSGVYLRGRYEVQIEDNHGKPVDSHFIGGVYGFLTPNFNVAKPAGEWQTYEITVIGRRVKIVFNGEQIIDRQEIPGITGGALDSREGEPGPIMIQGDHGPIEFRKLVIIPITE